MSTFSNPGFGRDQANLRVDNDADEVDVNLSHILMLYVGGTIGMKKNKEGVLRPARGYLAGRLAGLPQFHDPTQPLLTTPLSRFGKRIHYEIHEWHQLLDSSNMGMEDWIRIAEDIERNYNFYDAFIVLHGTDTMAYTASALSFMLENLSKPIILTGSQVPILEEPNDAVDNLLGALTIAGHYNIPEVCLYFNNKLMRGNRTSKVDASAFNAFNSSNFPNLVKAGSEIKVAWNLIRDPPSPTSSLLVHKEMNPNVGVLKLFPGITQATIKNFLQEPLEGCVMETYGSGNAPDNRKDFLEVLKAATDRGLVIVNITQCGKGTVKDSTYSTGQALANAGVISGFDMTTEAALAKLSFLLSNKDLTKEQVRKQMKRNLRGELTEPSGPTKYSLRDQVFFRAVSSALELSTQKTPEMNEIRKALLPILLCAAAGEGNILQLNALLLNGADVNGCDYELRTPLHVAAAFGHVEVVKFLIDRGANVNVIDRLGNTPLSEVQNLKNEELIEILKKNGAREIDLSTVPLPTSASTATLFGTPRLNSFLGVPPSISGPGSSPPGNEPVANGMA